MRRLLALLLLLLCSNASAHEVRPGYLEIKSAGSNGDSSPVIYDVLWKVPVKGPVKLVISVVLPEDCKARAPVSSQVIDAARIERWQVSCAGDIAGGIVSIDGLQNTITDVLLRLQHAGGSSETVRLTPTQASYEVQGEQAMSEVAITYLILGVEHILLGIDHLLFVFALLLIVSGWRRLVATITAFTVAHSITLVSATLGWVQVPQQPVEAVIALSILFLATEIVHGLRGRPALTARQPWIVAFVFGLLHGFGFAGALAEVGLPQQAIPLALLFFNVGVELGQLVFVAAVLVLGQLLQSIGSMPIRQGQLAASYVIGGLAAMWTIERVAGFWT